MSTHVVDESNVERIATIIRYGFPENRMEHFKKLLIESGWDIDTTKGFHDLCVAMHSMNVIATTDHHKHKGFTASSYVLSHKYKATTRTSIFQELKSIDCFLYQCDEEVIRESPLLKLIKDLRNQVANVMIRGLPEYNIAAWE